MSELLFVLSLGLPGEDFELSARALRRRELGDAYDNAWEEWSADEDAALWDATVGDGV